MLWLIGEVFWIKAHATKLITAVLVTILATVGFVLLNTDSSHASVASDFINRLKAPIEKVSRQNHLYPSVMMAQAIVESDFGQSTLSTDANNYFGIKGTYDGHSVTMETGEYSSKGKHYMTAAQFKQYPSAEASIRDNAYLLRHGTLTDPDYYAETWTTNAVISSDAAMALATTYATDMDYGNKLNAVIVKYDLNRLDGDTGAATTGTAGNINQQIEQSLKKELGTSTATKVADEKKAEQTRSKITRMPETIIPRSVFEPKNARPTAPDEYTLQLNLPLEKIIKKGQSVQK